ncbi:MAG: DUF445 domain-containing protein [Arcobacteraceae bacterium]|nr:DUF445 domain-containing protein [Arcobacteraceae bacterium]
MNKSLGTNLIAVVIMLVGFLIGSQLVMMVGLFALSGAVTNWLAIYMLFEKVPFLYGSGVIENRFEQFKESINNLIMEQFFTKENLDKFFKEELHENKKFDFTKLIDSADFTKAFDSLKDAVMESSFGGMLGIFGGVTALEPLKDPFETKMKKAINEIVHTDTFQITLQETIKNSDISEDIYNKIQVVVVSRLDELEPKMVKQIVQQMIKEHLGWLVVWGGFFGGLIGLISSFILS